HLRVSEHAVHVEPREDLEGLDPLEGLLLHLLEETFALLRERVVRSTHLDQTSLLHLLQSRFDEGEVAREVVAGDLVAAMSDAEQYGEQGEPVLLGLGHLLSWADHLRFSAHVALLSDCRNIIDGARYG